ncbi:MAG: chlorite dismutase [Candidatus Nitronauta litoralis]|uniref:Chlorite dismutase n=1 Tax=Candidatus Nitronauta litoralis TaxID=2705533 RepID=A0A7T0BYD3_9BACT|nr:MAG: chlorite dismutase [Candidatus Nitronauta litoralis]
MAIDDKELETLMPALTVDWTEDAKARMLNVPFFVRKSVVRGIETFAKEKGLDLIDDAVVSRARQEREGAAIEARQAERTAQVEEGKEVKRQYVNFSFYKLDPAFRRQPKEVRERARQEFIDLLTDIDSEGNMIMICYTLIGVRADADLMLWRISYEMEDFQKMSTRMYQTELGKWLITTDSYLSQTKRSMYMDTLNPEHEEDRTHIIPGKAKYLFIYPFVKKREWYLLTKHTRQGIMDEHIFVGNKYPSVKLNTTYCFGLDDYEFVVAFESDEPGDFVDLVMDLRETEGSRFTEKDTPIYTCTAMAPEDAVNALGI